jgi:hypothetical protein
VRLQTLYVDIDCAKEGDGLSTEEIDSRKNQSLARLLDAPIRPHAIVETKNGLQVYWQIKSLPAKKNLKLFEAAEVALITFFDADPAAKDPTRVLRFPGFLHKKDPRNPFLCRLLLDELGRPRYSLANVIKTLPTSKPEQKIPRDDSVENVVEGGRNVAAASMAGKILAKLEPGDFEAGWEELKHWNNEKCVPPLSETELRQVLENIIKKRSRDEEGGMNRKPQSATLIELAEQSGDIFFHNQYGQPHVAVVRGKSHFVFAVTDPMYKQVLAKKLWDEMGKAAHPGSVDSAISVLAAKAKHDGEEIPLHNRIARVKDTFWYDLVDDAGRAVQITKDGYRVVDNPPILFRRYGHQRPQVVPSTPEEADASLLLDFVNLQDPEQRKLLLVWTATCFMPDFPHPIINFYGPQGSSKTVLARMLKTIIDPSLLETVSLSVNTIDLIQKLNHHLFIFFDNLQKLPVWISDELCRAVTGGGFSKRKLFSDDEDIMYSFKRCVGLNGINLVATRPDLLDRSILFRFERIGGQKRMSEKKLWPMFELARPRILGGFFQAISKAMAMPPIEIKDMPRMADFAQEGCSLAEALGIPHQDFLAAYKGNRSMQHEEAINEDSVGIVVSDYMNENVGGLRGTPSEVYRMLKNHAENEMGINIYATSFPNSPQSFTRRLNELATNFWEMGIRINTHGKKNGQRWTVIEWAKVESAPHSSSSKKQKDDRDDEDDQ